MSRRIQRNVLWWDLMYRIINWSPIKILPKFICAHRKFTFHVQYQYQVDFERISIFRFDVWFHKLKLNIGFFRIYLHIDFTVVNKVCVEVFFSLSLQSCVMDKRAVYQYSLCSIVHSSTHHLAGISVTIFAMSLNFVFSSRHSLFNHICFSFCSSIFKFFQPLYLQWHLHSSGICSWI